MQETKTKTRLGLDLGTNSIGWCLFATDDNGNVEKVIKSGVRIFASGRNPKSYSSLNEDRRAARQARRRRDRFLQRQKALMCALVKRGFMPDKEEERKELEKKDPYKFRHDAIKEQLDPFEVGRALFHINQRRGFKSNRKTDRGGSDGPVAESVNRFREELGGSTVGQHLHKLRECGMSVRARRYGTTKQDLYSHYPDRQLLLDEFEAIWEKQSNYANHKHRYTPEAYEHLKDVIFRQRDLKKPIVGNCIFFPEEKRIAHSSPVFQQFRILQEVNNIKIRNTKLSEQLRNKIIDKLCTSKNLS